MPRSTAEIIRLFTDPLVRNDGRGHTTAYPWGVLGRGYAGDDGQVSALARHVRINVVLSPVVGVVAVQIDPAGAIVAAMTYLVVYGIVAHILARGLRPVPAPISDKEALRRFAAQLVMPLLTVNLVLSLMFILLSVALLQAGMILTGAAGVAVFGAGLALTILLIRRKQEYEEGR